MKTSVLIIGGGLSGVTVAHLLARSGIDSLLVEARSLLGGRILSPQTGVKHADNIAAAVDLGPSWFWPDQHAISTLIKDVGLSKAVYEQVSRGKSVIEYANGSIAQSQGGVSMAGSLRISGGMVSLVSALASTLPRNSILCSTIAQSITLSEEGVVTLVRSGTQIHEIASQHVVLALPPRVVAGSIEIQPVIAPDYQERLKSVSTWMAGEAKIVATYAKPFWQEKGLSGDGMSQIGPMIEIHDASPVSGGPHALFGFVGVDSSQREHNEASIKQAAVEQFARMFGPEGAAPLEVYFKDWAFDSFTATSIDRSSQRAHPYTANINRTECKQRLIWAGSEMAGSNCAYAGYLEGAVEAANRAVQLLVQ